MVSTRLDHALKAIPAVIERPDAAINVGQPAAAYFLTEPGEVFVDQRRKLGALAPVPECFPTDPQSVGNFTVAKITVSKELCCFNVMLMNLENSHKV